MIVGCYTLDLYCDTRKRCEHSDFTGLLHIPNQYTGRTFTECRKHALIDGWIFHRNKTVTCPKCASPSPQAASGGEGSKLETSQTWGYWETLGVKY